MSHTREKFNTKARQSTAGPSRKKSKQKNRTEDASQVQIDPNVTIHVPKTREEKEQEKKEKLRQELAAQSDSKWNSKKKKRLDKYIDKKLKKEDRLRIFEKLSQSQAQLPTSLNFQSSSTLGTGRVTTHRERLERLEDKEVRRAIAGRSGKRKRHDDSYAVIGPSDDEDEGDEDMAVAEDERHYAQKNASQSSAKGRQVVVFDSVSISGDQPVASTSTAVGSALRRNPDGTIVQPKVWQRAKGKKTSFQSWRDKSSKSTSFVQPDSDASFDSSDSANDSSEEESSGRDEEKGDKFEGSGSDSGDDSAGESPAPTKRKAVGFKDWAMKQLDVAKGHDVLVDSQDPSQPVEQAIPSPTKKRKITDSSKPVEMRGPLGEDIILPATSFAQRLQTSEGRGAASSSTKIKAVSVTRSAEVEEARLLLPIVAEEQSIMEAVLLNPVVIICGETGSGKTTQVPQFLYEAGFGTPGSDNPGMIGVTQPRRVAAMSMASRVAHELSLTASRVSYQIRYDATVSASTSIKFMTDGVLLRELATDFLLTKYSVVIIDEAHERSMNTDILIGVLSRVLKLREEMWKDGKDGAKPLRLIIMSATLRVSDFAENNTLFPSPPPIINVAARQHLVTIHFNRRTSSDYVTEATNKASKIHTRLPPGGILIFLTGQNEIVGVCRKLEAKFGQKILEEKKKRRGLLPSITDSAVDRDTTLDNRTVDPAQADVEPEDVDLGTAELDDLAFDVDTELHDRDPEALDSDNERGVDEELGIDAEKTDSPMHIVPLYSLLPSDKQMRVFRPPPPGCRLVVVSTNVAETSLTIPGIRYVVDCGRAKERRYDVANGIQAFQVSWISKASAAQRAGRAGRTGPGHCYRLYSSALFEHHFDAFSQPEILRMPIEGVVLQMKSMHIDVVVNFPFPTPPDRMILRKAETILTHLGAFDVPSDLNKGSTEVKTGTLGGQITKLGKTMSLFPLSPRFSKMLVIGQQQGCLPYVISIVSALSVGDPFLYEEGLENEESDDHGELAHITSATVKAKEVHRLRRKALFQSQHMHSSLGNSTSDMFKILSVVGAYEYAGGGHQFCAKHFVRPKAMEEIHKLRAQISNIVQVNFPGIDTGFIPKLCPPNDLQLKILRQLLTAGFIDQVAVRKDLVGQGSLTGIQYATSKDVAYKALGISQDVFIHPSSVLANVPPPGYLVFHEVVQTTCIWIKGVTIVNPAWLSSLGKMTLCSFSKPVKNSLGTLMTIPHFGPDGWELPPIKADMQQ